MSKNLWPQLQELSNFNYYFDSLRKQGYHEINPWGIINPVESFHAVDIWCEINLKGSFLLTSQGLFFQHKKDLFHFMMRWV